MRHLLQEVESGVRLVPGPDYAWSKQIHDNLEANAAHPAFRLSMSLGSLFAEYASVDGYVPGLYQEALIIEFAGEAFASTLAHRAAEFPTQVLGVVPRNVPPSPLSQQAGTAPELGAMPPHDLPVANPRVTSAANSYWDAVRREVHGHVARLYEEHLRLGVGNNEQLVNMFAALPGIPRVSLEDFGLTQEELFLAERIALTEALAAQRVMTSTISDAYEAPLPYHRLCPFPLAVLFQFIEKTGIAAEFPFAFFTRSADGWLTWSIMHCSTLAGRTTDHALE